MGTWVKEGVQGKKPIGAILRTSHVMPEDKNTTCGRMSNPRLNQLNQTGPLLSSELAYLREVRGEDNL